MMQLKQTRDLHSSIYQDSLAIRQAVFVDEQHVPADMEIDAFEDQALYLVGYVDQQPVATLRLITEGSAYHVQRVAVSKAARHQGFGQQLMLAAEQLARAEHKERLTLNAQLTAEPFYARLGYQATAKAHFLDAGIEHQEMLKNLQD